MNLLEKIDAPLFVLDRRHIWNREKRRRWHHVLEAIPMPAHRDEEVQAAAGQAIGFLKLTAIVSAGVAPLFLVFFFLMQSLVQAKLSDSRELLTRDMDSRYVNTAVDNVRMTDYGNRISENTAINRAQEARIQTLELRLQQIQTTVDQIRATQLAAKSGAAR